MRVGGVTVGSRESGRDDPEVSAGFLAEEYLVHVVCDINHLPGESLALWFSQCGEDGTKDGDRAVIGCAHFEAHW